MLTFFMSTLVLNSGGNFVLLRSFASTEEAMMQAINAILPDDGFLLSFWHCLCLLLLLFKLLV